MFDLSGRRTPIAGSSAGVGVARVVRLERARVVRRRAEEGPDRQLPLAVPDEEPVEPPGLGVGLRELVLEELVPGVDGDRLGPERVALDEPC